MRSQAQNSKNCLSQNCLYFTRKDGIQDRHELYFRLIYQMEYEMENKKQQTFFDS